MSAVGQLSGWFRALSARERVLIAVMLALLAVVIGWLGIARPLAAGLARAEARHAEAVLLAGRVEARAAALARLDRAARARPAVPGDLATRIGAAAEAAGFAGAAVTPQGAGRAALIIPAARPAAAFAWIAALDGEGVVVERLAVRANADQTVQVEAGLIAAPGAAGR
ncbi:type II secretion system protein M [Sphingomonas changnyeongensis]|uniref:Type II secretion system protein M n=1 Tax=Sphingomonas changnyeongensis TaxID=2698679 RepID=A0A7Z2S9K7_9SPHN|nr:type II secretion system protein GspM [Sphingomonas changnyeongensis]QHL90854.1 type II secretion system protein M [Sphingomonas changnyeongensis]